MVSLTRQSQTIQKSLQCSDERPLIADTVLSVLHHQHQNYSEGDVGSLKFKLLKLFHNTPYAPIKYWFYGSELLDQVAIYLKILWNEVSAQKY